MNRKQAEAILTIKESQSAKHWLGDVPYAKGYLECMAQVEKIISVLRQYQAIVELNEHPHTDWAVYNEGKDCLKAWDSQQGERE